MITFTQLTPAALDEAAANVEAEWMRLRRQGAACVRRPGPPPLTGMGSQLIPKEARLEVWATERSPPCGQVNRDANHWR
jgi:hypothetical protein